MQYYQIGDLYFGWNENIFPLTQDEYMKNFSVDSVVGAPMEDVIIYEPIIMNLGEYCKGNCLTSNEMYELYESEKGKFIAYHWGRCRFGFGYWLEDLEKGNRIPCYIHPKMLTEIPLSAVRFFSTAGMHSKLLQRQNGILHASYVEWKDRAILFTAPSQVGKSTQANLWKQYENARIINGDRALLRQKDNIWYAGGYPCCGSSKICINRTLPLAMIVLLEQGKENKVVECTMGQKIRALISGIEVFVWNEKEIEQAFQLATEIAANVPILKFSCKPDADAVNVLKEYWEEQYGTSC